MIMQERHNEQLYLKVQKDLRKLILKSPVTSYGFIINDFKTIEDEVMWSDWGMHGHLTKKYLIEYLRVLNSILVGEKNGVKFFNAYVFDKEVKIARRKLNEQYLKDFKE